MTPLGPYHRGSRAVQDLVGVREAADHLGRSIGDGIRPVAAAFLELQPMLVIGGADQAGAVWASLLTGRPGFVRATGPRQMSVAGGPRRADPLAQALAQEGAPVGAIALDPRTRRRLRLNGRARPTPRGLAIETDRVFANCPKYIQKRQLPAGAMPGRPAAPRHGVKLTGDQRAFIADADTFFLATVHAEGADASHRGGNPGFVQVPSPYELTWRDYPGNSMFLSLGNLATTPAPGSSSSTGSPAPPSSSPARPAPNTATTAHARSVSPSPRRSRPSARAPGAGPLRSTPMPIPPRRTSVSL